MNCLGSEVNQAVTNPDMEQDIVLKRASLILEGSLVRYMLSV